MIYSRKLPLFVTLFKFLFSYSMKRQFFVSRPKRQVETSSALMKVPFQLGFFPSTVVKNSTISPSVIPFNSYPDFFVWIVNHHYEGNLPIHLGDRLHRFSGKVGTIRPPRSKDIRKYYQARRKTCLNDHFPFLRIDQWQFATLVVSLLHIYRVLLRQQPCIIYCLFRLVFVLKDLPQKT